MSAHVSTMHAHSPGSYSISLMGHGALVLLIVLSAFVFNDVTKKQGNEVIEIIPVAGEGNNYRATEAPALGVPDAIAFSAPPSSPPAAQQTPLVQQPMTPVQAAPETPVAPVTPQAVDPDSLVLPTSKKAQPKTQPKQTTVQPMSKAEFDKLHGAKNANAQSSKVATTTTANKGTQGSGKAITAPKVGGNYGKGILKGVVGGTGMEEGAGGTALSTTQRDLLAAYLALLGQRIKEAHDKPEGVSDELSASVEYQLSKDGVIGAVKIVRSSGNRIFDDSVLKAFRSVRSIGPRPDGRSSAITATFRMKEEE